MSFEAVKKTLSIILPSGVLAWGLMAGDENLSRSDALITLLAVALVVGVLGWALLTGRRAVLLFLGSGVGGLIGWSLLAGEGPDSFDFDTGLAPAEYLYLDNGRVLSYLSQVKGDLSENEKRSIKVTQSLNAGIEQSPAKVGASRSTEQFVEQVVTPTAASNFFRFLDELQGGGAPKTYLKTLEAGKFDSGDYRSFEEGDFVALEGVTVRLPPYAADYYFVKRFGSAYTERASADRLGCLLLRKAERRSVREWLRPFGRNPRVTLTASARSAQTDKLGLVKILLPVEYSSLADEQSLLARARLTVVGKVIRRIEPGGDDYVDTPTRTVFGPRLRKIPRLLLAKKDCTTAPRRRQVARERKARLRNLRKKLFKNLKKDTRLQSRGLLILPVAIYSTGRNSEDSSKG